MSLKEDLKRAELDRMTTNLALYDLIFKKHQIKMKVRDGENVLHEIYISRLNTNGIIVEACKKYGQLSIVDRTDLERDIELYPNYYREVLEAIKKWEADRNEKRR